MRAPDVSLLIIDGPTAALDACAEFEFSERFRQLRRGRAALLVSHRFSTVRMADQILGLYRGTAVEHGTHTGLIARGGLHAKCFELEAAGDR